MADKTTVRIINLS